MFDDIPLGAYHTFVSRIKLLSEMKLNVRDAAQDGRFTIGLGDKDIEMRVSVIPAEFGETIVMRILDPSATMVTLPQLGLRADNLALVKKKISQPNGLDFEHRADRFRKDDDTLRVLAHHERSDDEDHHP